MKSVFLLILLAGGLFFFIHFLYNHSSEEPRINQEWDFSVDGTISQWALSSGIQEDQKETGYLAGIIQGEDPAGLRIRKLDPMKAAPGDMMKLRLKVSGIDYQGEENRALWRKRGWIVHWRTAEDQMRRVFFYPYQDESWHTYIVPLGREPGWTGTVTAISLYPQRIKGSRFALQSVQIGQNLSFPSAFSRISRSLLSCLSAFPYRYIYLFFFFLMLLYIIAYRAPNHCFPLFFVFILALAVRMLYISDPSLDGMVIGDQARLDYAAQNIVTGKDLMGDIFWPPVWQYVLASVYLFFGHSYPAVRLLLAITGALTCIAIYQMGREIAGPHTALLAAVLLALSAGPIYYTAFLFTDSLNSLFTAVSFLLLCYALKADASSRIRIFTGIMFGITALTRSEILGFLPLVFLFYYMRHRNLNMAIKRGAVVFLAAVMTILPKLTANYVAYDRFVPINIGLGMNLYIANMPSLAAWRKPALATSDSPAPEKKRIPDKFLTDYPNRIDRHDALLKETLKKISREPGIFFKNLGTKCIDFFSTDCRFFNDMAALPFSNTLPFFPLVHLRPLFLMSALSLLFMRKIGFEILPSLLYTIYFGMVHSFFLLDPRYHLAIIPFLALFSAIFLVEGIAFVQAKISRLLAAGKPAPPA